MMAFNAQDLALALPEVKLAAAALIVLLVGVLTPKEHYRLVAGLSILALVVVAALVCMGHGNTGTAFNGMFITDSFAVYMKALVLTGAAVSLLMATGYVENEKINRIEYPVLVLFSTLGMMLMISANNMISLYMALELQSLPLYVLAALRRDSVRSTEAGLKYFVLGALSSGLLLYGMSLIYGFTGATGFPEIATAVQGHAAPGVITGMVLILAALAFKISAVPFHMWAPDVYEGAPTPVTAFFAIAPKIAAIALLTRVLTGPFGGLAAEWTQVLIVMSVASMALGGIAAIVQTNIKRLLAYSSIGHVGYALIGLIVGGAAGLQAVIVYMTLYVVMSAGAFCVVLSMKKGGKMVENISDLSGLGKSRPALALAMAIMMFSMAGIPPLAGFFGKLFIFQVAMNAGLYVLSVIGVLTSVIAAYYYIRIIKVMYFEESESVLDAAEGRSLGLVLSAATLAIMVFIIVPSPVVTGAATAAQALVK